MLSASPREGCGGVGGDKYTEKDFDEMFATLPRWTKTRYAVIYGVNNVDENYRIRSYAAWIFDCETGEKLIDT